MVPTQRACPPDCGCRQLELSTFSGPVEGLWRTRDPSLLAAWRGWPEPRSLHSLGWGFGISNLRFATTGISRCAPTLRARSHASTEQPNPLSRDSMARKKNKQAQKDKKRRRTSWPGCPGRPGRGRRCRRVRRSASRQEAPRVREVTLALASLKGVANPYDIPGSQPSNADEGQRRPRCLDVLTTFVAASSCSRQRAPSCHGRA